MDNWSIKKISTIADSCLCYRFSCMHTCECPLGVATSGRRIMSKSDYDKQTAKNRRAIEQKIALSKSIARLVTIAEKRRVK